MAQQHFAVNLQRCNIAVKDCCNLCVLYGLSLDKNPTINVSAIVEQYSIPLHHPDIAFL